MPPKAARGTARRGRGRGKAPEGDSAEASAPTIGEPASSPTSSFPTAIEVDPITTPQSQDFGRDEPQPAPGDSPASIPTETPAPTPVRSTPQIQAANETRGHGGAVGSRGRGRGSGVSKFKPRIVRRDQTERENLEKEERARLAANAERAASRSRGRGRRARGDAMGRGTGMSRGMPTSTASGPFGMAPAAEMDRRPRPFGPGSGPKRESGPPTSNRGGGSGSGGVSGPSGVRFKTEMGTNTGYIGSGHSTGASGGLGLEYVPEPQYPSLDGEKFTPRVDIELINLISDDEEDSEPVITSRIGKSKSVSNSNKGGMRPVRLHREEHKQRVTMVNTDTSTTTLPADDDMVTIDEKLSTRLPEKEWQGVYQDDETVKVKFEPDLDPTLTSTVKAAPPESLSPTVEFKQPARKLAPSAIVEDDIPGLAKARTTRPSKHTKKPAKPIIQTEEDKAEYERHLEDVAILAHELGSLQTEISGQGKGKNKDTEGDIEMNDGGETQLDKKEGRLYLFQFPPVLPPLYNPAKQKKEGEGGDKLTSTTNQVDLTAVAEVKDEEEVIIKTEPDSDAKDRARSAIPEEGYIGKLIVRESGRVELDWGGTRMLIGRGVDASFLSTVVITDNKEKEGEPEGVAMGMGKVMGKFIVTPDWESMCEDLGYS